MKTPIVDFVKKYARKHGVRAHMPGHKGKFYTGAEKYDVTEIDGADVLYDAKGIIKQSQDNATKIFDTYATFYSTEGSSLAIKAMLYLVSKGVKNPTVLAVRNVHKTFVYGCALLGIEPCWMYPKKLEHISKCIVGAKDIDDALSAMTNKPCAVYLTSPDYLGNMQDVKGIASVCDKHGVPLLVDNAHGAYLAFMKDNAHPIKLGATMCCDSAHKTLTALTGGAYLHIGNKGREYAQNAMSALALFASTSPSYLILQSLDRQNGIINCANRFETTKDRVEKVRRELEKRGFTTVGNEPFKLSIDLIKSGVDAKDLLSALDKNNVTCEFLDDEYAVFMFSNSSKIRDFKVTQKAILSVEKKNRNSFSHSYCAPEKVMSVRDAIMSESEKIDVTTALNRVCASPTVSCPPAIPIIVSGERISQQSIALFNRYGIKEIEVVKEK